MNHWLVATDIDAIQSYLLQSVHLRTIAGASELIVDADEFITSSAVESQGMKIVSTGGIGLFQFDDECNAKKFCQDVHASYRRQCISGNLSTGTPVPLEVGKFGEAVNAAFQSLEIRKREGSQAGQLTGLSHAQTCQSCGLEPAILRAKLDREGDATLWLGEACSQKNEARDRWFWLEWMRELSPPDLKEFWTKIRPGRDLARDFNTLAGSHDLAIILADADGTGKKLKSLTSKMTDSKLLIDFSNGLKVLAKESLVVAINKVLADVFHPSADNPIPILPLFCGGDDFVIACRGDLALRLAATLCDHFSSAAKDWCPDGKLGLSASVVVTRPGFPFRIAHRIGDQLLRNAKRTARMRKWSCEGIGAIDYALITESIADAKTILNDREVHSSSGGLSLHLSGRPYQASLTGVDSIGVFIQAVEQLTAIDFPKSKLHELRQIFSRSSLDDFPIAPKDSDLNSAKTKIDLLLGNWVERIRRQPNLFEAASETAKKVGLDPELKDSWGNHLLSNGGQVWRTPLGDLSDGARLVSTVGSAPNIENMTPEDELK